LSRLDSPRAQENKVLLKQIQEIHEESRGTYGSPRVHAELVLGLGLPVNLKRVARLMREAGIQGLYRRRRHGCGGTSLREAWNDDDARAYFGTAVPGFPNFFCLYGPNTQAGHGGSVIFFIEMQVSYVLTLLRQMIERGLGAIECRQDVYDRYNERVDTAHANMIWTHRGMDTYYRNSHGRVVVNNPFRVVDFWNMTRKVRLDDWVTEPGAPDPMSSSRA
jgi:hypothetical protein